MLGERLSLIKIVWRVVFGGGRRVWDAEVEVRRWSVSVELQGR